MKNYKVILLLGNFGVGKSTILKKLFDNENGLREPFFCAIKEYVNDVEFKNCYILGSHPMGADSISNQKKEVVRLKIIESDRNVFIAGVFYNTEVDFEYYIKKGLTPIFVYLKTSKKVNKVRMKGRGGAAGFNEATWARNENRFSMIENYAIRKKLKFHIIDNDQDEQTVFEEFLQIMKTIKFE